MIQFLTPFIFQTMTRLSYAIAHLRDGEWLNRELSPDLKETYSRLGCLLEIEDHKNVLNDTALQIKALSLRHSLAAGEHFTGQGLARELEGLLLQIQICLGQYKYAYFRAPNDAYFEQEKLFGCAVYALFPEARDDIKNAGNCIAAELYTAAVFHLMRASEIGLRTLAAKVSAKPRHKGKPQPLDTATWEKVIQALKKKLDAARAMNHGEARAKKINFYSDLADRCSFIKDLWRNDVMHARASYGYHDAVGAFDRVKGFMQLLCEM